MNIRKLCVQLIILSSLCIFLFGCSEKEPKKEAAVEEKENTLEELQFDTTEITNLMEEYGDTEAIDVEFSTSPKTLSLNKPVSLSVKVYKEGKPVTDASVYYGIAKVEDLNNAITVDAKGDGKGNYTLTGEFSESGKYSLIAHVTTAGSHQMLPYEFTIK